jgi:hypothetical protein
MGRQRAALSAMRTKYSFFGFIIGFNIKGLPNLDPFSCCICDVQGFKKQARRTFCYGTPILVSYDIPKNTLERYILMLLVWLGFLQ